MNSILHLSKEEIFGNTPVWNKDTGKSWPLYCAPFTLNEHDYSNISHDDISQRLKIVISNKGYYWYNIHWASKIVLYWKEI